MFLVTIKFNAALSRVAPSAAIFVRSLIWNVTGILQFAVTDFSSKLDAGLVFAVRTASPPWVPFP